MPGLGTVLFMERRQISLDEAIPSDNPQAPTGALVVPATAFSPAEELARALEYSRDLRGLSAVALRGSEASGRVEIVSSDQDHLVVVPIPELSDEHFVGVLDVESARTCPCQCHGRAPTPLLHNAGRTCNCQLTPEERRAALEALLSDPVWEDVRQSFDADRTRALERASELGISRAHFLTVAAPIQLVGRCSHLWFYFRERHGKWSLEILEREYDRDADGEICADGVGEFGSLSQVVELVATTLTDEARRRSCEHTDARRFCPDCGTRISS